MVVLAAIRERQVVMFRRVQVPGEADTRAIGNKRQEGVAVTRVRAGVAWIVCADKGNVHAKDDETIRWGRVQ